MQSVHGANNLIHGCPLQTALRKPNFDCGVQSDWHPYCNTIKISCRIDARQACDFILSLHHWHKTFAPDTCNTLWIKPGDTQNDSNVPRVKYAYSWIAILLTTNAKLSREQKNLCQQFCLVSAQMTRAHIRRRSLLDTIRPPGIFQWRVHTYNCTVYEHFYTHWHVLEALHLYTTDHSQSRVYEHTSGALC